MLYDGVNLIDEVILEEKFGSFFFKLFIVILN